MMKEIGNTPDQKPNSIVGEITEMSHVTVSLEEARQLTDRILQAQGYTDGSERERVIEILMYAELRGNSQGLFKLCGPGLPREQSQGEIELENHRPSASKIDGMRNPGMLVMQEATEEAIRLVERTGIGIVATRNSASSTGAVGYYVEQIANKGFVGVVASGTPAIVAPYGASAPLFGTNPYGIGVPTDSEPIVLDSATSAMAWYDLKRQADAGQSIEKGIAIDSDGNEVTDAAEALKGSIQTFGAHRGSGLALMLEILTGPFVGAVAGIGTRQRSDWGNLVVAIDPALFVSKEEFLKETQAMREVMHSLPTAPGTSSVRLPGEGSAARAKGALEKNTIELPKEVYAELLEKAS